jgi:hypothetical protein
MGRQPSALLAPPVRPLRASQLHDPLQVQRQSGQPAHPAAQVAARADLPARPLARRPWVLAAPLRVPQLWPRRPSALPARRMQARQLQVWLLVRRLFALVAAPPAVLPALRPLQATRLQAPRRPSALQARSHTRSQSPVRSRSQTSQPP